MHLVIVESPAKAKIINKYLGKDYKVMASFGHIRDLLAKDGSVDTNNDFAMTWELSDRGKKCIKEIKAQLTQCDDLLLATDPDREGEAISWHIKEVLEADGKVKVPFRRIVFHEITKTAISNAIKNSRSIDLALVDAYLARRALDYLVGFSLSPILWRKLPGSKSAGRVQSVALRIVVDREQEIEKFKEEEYWSLDAVFLSKDGTPFDAKLINFQGKKLEKMSIQNVEMAESMRAALISNRFNVGSIESKIVKRNPAPPFITSTLQQEASRKLGFSAKKTMMIAQQLYEGVEIDGETQALITYMRTDSVNLSADALKDIRDLIGREYGEKFVPASARVYKTKVKNAQEAHEAIRPINISIMPEQLHGRIKVSRAAKISESDLIKLYALIWRRAVASQMASADMNKVQVDIVDDNNNVFRANGSTIVFEGFLKLYVEGSDSAEKEDDNILPQLHEGEETSLNKLDAVRHVTMPPPRFSEASLVRKLEELGIGRPSTYATILQVLQDRGYVRMEKKYFVPELRGRMVTAFLMLFFGSFLEYDFTAALEQSLDDVSNGAKSKLDVLTDFWQQFHGDIDQVQGVSLAEVIDKMNQLLHDFLFGADGNGQQKCPQCADGELSLKIGRYGAFIGCSRYPDCKYVKQLGSSSTPEVELQEVSPYPKVLGNDPVDQREILLKKGPYGLYLEKAVEEAADPEEGKRKKKKASVKLIRASLPKMVNESSIDIELASILLRLPTVLGQYNGEDIMLYNGRFGPYLMYREKRYALPKVEQSLRLTLKEAVELIKSAK